MLPIVPSQIVLYIDKRVPAVRERPQELSVLGPEHAGMLGHVVDMIERVPPHLVVLGADADAEFGEAVHAIRAALRGWESGNHSIGLRPLVGMNGLHPLVAVRKWLARLPDEGPGTPDGGLDFIGDEALRTVLATDLASMERLLDVGTWKAATVIAGSVAEALLLDALLKREAEAREAALRFQPVIKGQLDSWDLNELTTVARALEVIDEDTADLSALARRFRNLIHPGRSRRLEITCDRGTAFATVAAVEHVIRDLRARYKSE